MSRGRGRPTDGIVRVSIELQLPHDVIGWLNEQTFDPITQKPKYRGRASLIERLCRQEMARQHHAEENPESDDPNLALRL